MTDVPAPERGEPAMDRRLAAILAADIAGYSRLMGEDEAATVRDLKGHQAAVLPLIGTFGGRVIDTAGDGILAEFASVTHATECAIRVQALVAERNRDVPEFRRMRFRIGINIGDVVHDDQRIYGDGINVAARLQGLAAPGGICVSRHVYDQLNRSLKSRFNALGSHRLKNIAQPVEVFAMPADAAGNDEAIADDAGLEQQIRFCKARDGTQLAWSAIGRGPALVKTGNWMTHLEHDLQSPVWRHLYRELAKRFTVIRYDARGNGLSDRDVDEISFDAFVGDLETVVEAAGAQRFVLFGISQGCAISVAYAARHAERVSRLVLYGGYAQGWTRRAMSDAQREEYAAMLTLMRVGWGRDDPAFRQIFTSQFIPGASKEVWEWYNELQRISVSGETAARMFRVHGDVDVTSLLPQVAVPTLVMHARADARVPFDAGRRLAAGIPGARFVPLDGSNHMFLQSDAAFGQFLAHLRSFVAVP